jgi:beta-glucosidase-like glycosyl hydrolase/CubicO group peptidase (beta-lactamase class C family)
MTLEEKVGQLIMAWAYGHYISTGSDEYGRLVRLVQDHKVGGLVMFQGDVYEEAVLLNKLQRLAKVPLLVASDFERGVAMRVRRGTYFPDAMAIGATRNPEFAYNIGRAIAEEARAIGVHQDFAPVADVNNNPENPVINTRSFGESPALVGQMVSAYVRGLNDGGVVSTAKHFPGHGDTGTDSHLDLPVLPFNRSRLDSLELVSFKNAIDSGVMSVMIGHLAVPALDSNAGIPASLSSIVINKVLKEDLHFEGVVVTDAMDMAGLLRGRSIGDAAVKALEAGADIILMPADETITVNAVLGAVSRGTLTQARIDESVRKILLIKQWLGLDKERYVDVDRIADHVATREHLQLAKDVARAAITLVRNEGNILPLPQYGRKKLAAVIISDTDDNRTEVNRAGNQYPNEPFGAYFSQLLRRRYGSVETFRLTPSSNALNFDSVLTRLKRAEIILMPLYVKVRSGSGKIGIPENMTGFLSKIAELQAQTIVISFGNPYVISAFPKAHALVCAYSDAEVLVEATVEALFGEIEVRGTLPVSIPGLFDFGGGEHYARSILRKDDPAYAGLDAAKLVHVDEIITKAIRDSSFPAAQVVVVRNGIIAYDKSFGTYTYDPASNMIDGSTLFDLASLTKVFATTPAVMKLYDQQKLSLDDRVGKFFPQFASASKRSITVRQLLLHTSGLPPFRKLYEVCKSPQEALDSVLATPLVVAPGDSTIYSDLGMIILGKIVEKIAGVPLSAFVTREFYQPLHMNSTVFTPSKAVWAHTAPTEIDTVWRKSLVRGTVHDENAALLGGVAGHAGLFSTASDLAVFMQMILNKGVYGGVRYLSDSIVAKFTHGENAGGGRALGWDLKSETRSSAGDLFSMSSFGHTGFTGTSVWADPERNLFVIFLTNRVYPTRANAKIFKVRPALHDAVVQAIQSKTDSNKADTRTQQGGSVK